VLRIPATAYAQTLWPIHFRTMQTVTSTTTVIIFGLLFSCGVDKPNTTFSKVRNEVIDKADILTIKQEDSVSQVIRTLRNDIGCEIAVLTIDSLGDKPVEEFSLRMADSLNLGRATHNDGLLITISRFDRKVRIEVGTGLENIIKDEIAAQIIREDMAPKFREDKYGLGIYIAVSRIAKVIRDNEKLVGTEPSWK
jgi:uncharacterized membrane protein YgcG